MKVDKSTMSRLLAELIKEGYCTRKENPNDKRQQFLSLTAKGSKMSVRIDCESDAFVEQAIIGLSPTDQKNRYRYADGLRMQMAYDITVIRKHDNHAVKNMIEQVLGEFGCTGAGYALHDDELHDLYAAYNNSCSQYYVLRVKETGTIQGAGGV